MRLLPWIIALALLALNLIQEGHVAKYKAERDEAQAKFQDGARLFWNAQTEGAAVRAAYRTRQLEMALKIKQQKLIIDAYEAELKQYHRETSGAIPAAAVPKGEAR